MPQAELNFTEDKQAKIVSASVFLSNLLQSEASITTWKYS